ncbi:MAG: site-specific DNA-methyltransferase [Acidimicrobiales bacterium]|nr:site-specific DNA-methyltransferase [Acidimicrobiales bacterium]
MAAADTPSPRRRRPTATSDFGVGRREGHDSSEFYARFAAPELSDDDTIPADPAVRAIDRVICGSSADMADVADGSVALVVTSPPYFAGKAYETELDAEHVPATYLEYLQMLRDVFAECVRTLEPGGRIAVNVANLGRRPYRNLAADVTSILQDDLRLLLRGEVVWVKQRGASGSCAWGSFQRATNPVLRDLTERVIIASKGRFDRPLSTDVRAARGLPHESTITRDEFMDATLDVWELPPESATRVGHPAPFPVALPERLIHLYTYRGDLVLDPFMGSGTTAVAAVRADRHFVGYDTDPDYVDRAGERVQAERDRLASNPTPLASVSSAAPSDPEPSDEVDLHVRARREGTAARELARTMLERAGFEQVDSGVKLHGVELSFSVRDKDDRTIYVDCSGAFTSVRPGLQRADTLWKALGKASVLSSASPRDRHGDAGFDLVLLSTDLPTANSTSGRALSAVLADPSSVLVDALTMDGDGLVALAELAQGHRPGDPGWSGAGRAAR